jgi:hypothetical protein
MKACLKQYTPTCLDLVANLAVELNDLKIIPSNYQSSTVISKILLENN